MSEDEVGGRNSESSWSEEDKRKLAALRRAIDEGDASGIAKGDVFARVRKKLGLPKRSRVQVPPKVPRHD